MADDTPQTIDLTPEIITIEAQQGTDVTLEFQLTDANGTAVDITNDTVDVTVKDDFDGNVKIATKSNGPSEHSDPANGKSIFVWTKTETTTSTPTEQVDWVYEVRRIFAGSGKEVIYIQGTLSLFPSVGLSS